MRVHPLHRFVWPYARYAMRRTPVYIALLWASLVVVALSPRPAAAHFGGSAALIVPATHVNPGETFELVAVDLTPNATVTLTMTRDDRQAFLGEAVADAEGHFTTALPLPADFPSGYAQLVAVARDETQASTWVLVGAPTASTPAPPGQPAWWADPSVVVLGVLVVGVVGMVGFALLRRSQPQRRPAPVANARQRRAAGKEQRRATRRGRG